MTKNYNANKPNGQQVGPNFNFNNMGICFSTTTQDIATHGNDTSTCRRSRQERESEILHQIQLERHEINRLETQIRLIRRRLQEQEEYRRSRAIIHSQERETLRVRAILTRQEYEAKKSSDVILAKAA